MSFKEKRSITSIIIGVLMLIGYCVYAYGRFKTGLVDNDIKFWSSIILKFVGISIVVTIIVQILFHILYSISIAIKEGIKNKDVEDKKIENSVKAEMVEDEMDKLIKLKSMRVGFVISGCGFLGGLLTVLLNYSIGVMINVMFISFVMGPIIEGFVQIYFYRRGVTNG